MSVLQTIPDIAKSTGVSREQVKTALKRANIEPAHTVKTGTRSMTLYDSEVASKAVDAYLDAMTRAEEERRAAEAQRLAEEAKPLSLSAIVEAVDGLIKADAFRRDHALISIEATLADTQTSVDKLLELVTKLSEQNVVLFRALGTMEADHTARLARLQNSLVDMQRDTSLAPAAPLPAPPSSVSEPQGVRITPLPPLPAPPPAPSAMSQALTTAVRTAAAAKPAKKLARVVLIGARGNDRAAIEREFKDCFDLRCLEDNNLGSEALKTQLRTADRVVLAFGSSSVTAVKNALKGSGVNVVHVNGGMSRLRDALTTLYVELGEAVPA